AHASKQALTATVTNVTYTGSNTGVTTTSILDALTADSSAIAPLTGKAYAIAAGLLGGLSSIVWTTGSTTYALAPPVVLAEQAQNPPAPPSTGVRVMVMA